MGERKYHDALKALDVLEFLDDNGNVIERYHERCS